MDESGTQTGGSSRRRRAVAIGAGVVVLALIAAGVGIWWFFRDDAPDEVALEAGVVAAEQAQATTAPVTSAATVASTDPPATSAVEEVAATADPPVTTAAAVEGIEGIWTVDTSLGEFDFESATGSFVGFRVQEELRGIGSTTAVGRTGAVEGTIEIAGTTVDSARIEADLSQLGTNDSRRDRAARGALNADEHPLATFVLTEPIELGEPAVGGDPVTTTAVGDLTVNDVTSSVTIPVEAQLVDAVIVVVGSLDVVFSDYDVAVPEAPIVVSAEDEGIMELQLLFTRGD